MTKKQWCSQEQGGKKATYEENVADERATVRFSDLRIRFERESKINSQRAVEMVPAVLKSHPSTSRLPQSAERAKKDLKKSLSKLAPSCIFRAFPQRCVLRIIRHLPLTSMLALATSCKSFNGIINEQNHGLKDVHTIRIDFEELRRNRIIVISVKRHEDDPMTKVERYMHCTRCPEVDNELDHQQQRRRPVCYLRSVGDVVNVSISSEQLLKLPCSPEGVGWVANILPALLVNAHIADVDFVGEHGVVLSYAFQFQKLSCRRRPFVVDKLSFGLRASANSGVACCMFWIQLLHPHKVKLYPLSGGLYLTYCDLRWFLNASVQKLMLYDLYSMNLRAISEVIWDWYNGRQTCLPHTEILFTDAPPNIEDFLKKIIHKTTGRDKEGRFALLRRSIDGAMKQLLVPCGQRRLIVKDYPSTFP